MYNHYVKTTFWSCIWNTLISHINYCNSLQPIEDFLYVHVYTRISQSIFFSEYSHLNRNAPTPAFLSYRKPVLVFGLEGTFCTFVSIICVLWGINTTDDSKSAMYFRLTSFVSGARRRLSNHPTIFCMVWKALLLYAEGIDTIIKLYWWPSSKLSWFILCNLSVTFS